MFIEPLEVASTNLAMCNGPAAQVLGGFERFNAGPFALGIDMDGKLCLACKQVKPLCEFYNDKTKKSGKGSYCKTCNRIYKKNHAAKYCEWSKSWRIKNREKTVAHRRMRTALQNGTLTKPTICQRCNNRPVVGGHHPDYSKPLEVEFLCRECHVIADRERRGEE